MRIKTILLTAVIAVFSCTAQPKEAPLPALAYEAGQVTEVEDAYGTFYAYVPETGPADLKILALIHGTPPEHDTAEFYAYYYVSSWVEFAEKYGFILLAPAFNQADFSSRKGELENALTGYRGLFGREIGADAWLLRLVQAHQQALGITDDQFYLYGHSAGGQFVGRFLVMHPELVKKAVITAAVTYPQPDTAVAWPYGMGELHTEIVWDDNTVRPVDIVPDPQLWLAATQVPLTVVVGLNDISEQLPRPGQKGENRVMIALNWVDAMAAFAEANGLESQFRIELFPGKGHAMIGLLKFSQAGLVPDAVKD